MWLSAYIDGANISARPTNQITYRCLNDYLDIVLLAVLTGIAINGMRTS